MPLIFAELVPPRRHRSARHAILENIPRPLFGRLLKMAICWFRREGAGRGPVAVSGHSVTTGAGGGKKRFAQTRGFLYSRRLTRSVQALNIRNKSAQIFCGELAPRRHGRPRDSIP